MGKKSLMQRVISAIVVALAISLPGFTHAQELEHRLPEAGNGDGMDTHLFRPAVDSKGFFSVNGSDILGSNDISFGLVMDYGHNIMRLVPGHGADALITHSFQGTFTFNYGVLPPPAIALHNDSSFSARRPVTCTLTPYTES